MIVAKIKDGFGGNASQKIFSSGAGYVSSDGFPSFGGKKKILPFSQKFSTGSGATDMRVAGTLASPVNFLIPTSILGDVYISAISFVIADDNPRLNQFGALTSLVNGCVLNYVTDENDKIQILPTLKTNFDFVRVAMGSPAFGTGDTSFSAGTAVGIQSEAFLPVIHFSDWIPNGIRLRKDLNDSLVFQVRDNTTGVDAFDAIAFGFIRLPE